MAKKESELMSKNAYAIYLGVSEKAIRNAVADGKIKKGWDADKQKIIKHLADKEYGFLHQAPKAGPGISKATLVKKLTSEKKHDKLSKTRTEFGVENDKSERPNKIDQKSDDLADGNDDLTSEQIADISKLETSELLKLLPITAKMSYKDALTANEIIEAALKKKKLEELEDILIRRTVVESTLFAFGSQLRKALLAIPGRVTDDMITAANKVEALNVLTEELTNVLDQYSNFESIKLTNK